MFDTIAASPADPFGSAAERIAWVLSRPPSPETQAVLLSLVDVPLTPRERVDVAVAWDRQLAAVSACAAAAAVAATVTNDPSPSAQDDLEAELALAMRRTDGEMSYQLHRQRRLLELPVMFGLLRAGKYTPRHADALLTLTADLLADAPSRWTRRSGTGLRP